MNQILKYLFFFVPGDDETKNNLSHYYYAICGALIVGILCHGMVMFNHFYFHDDVGELNGLHGLYLVTQGRWFLAFLFNIDYILWRNPLLPVFTVSITLLLIALIACVFVNFLNIKSKWLCFAIGGFLAAFPSNATLFGYLNASYYFIFALLIGCLGALISCRNSNLRVIIISISLITCSLAVYQTYIAFVISIFLIDILMMIINNPNIEAKKLRKRCKKYILITLISVILYFVITKLSLWITGLEMTSYKGADNYDLSPLTLFSRIPITIESFFFAKYSTIFFASNKWYYIIIVLLCYLFLILYAIRIFKLNKTNGAIFCFFILVLPIVFNVTYIVCPLDIIYSMMDYSYVLPSIFLLWMISYCTDDIKSNGRWINGLKVISKLILIMLLISYIKIDNMCYMKADLKKTNTISYFSGLIAQIKSTEGYTQKTPICFINDTDTIGVEDITLKNIHPFLEDLKLQPYRENPRFVNDNVWKEYMTKWCGFNPVTVDVIPDSKYDLIDKMPQYPDAGSIKFYGDTLYVNINNNRER